MSEAPLSAEAPDVRGTVTAMVTGATGQDGTLLVERLLRDGAKVHALVREAGKAREVLGPDPRLAFHIIDLAKPQGVAEAISSIRPDEFYNLAGLSSVASSFAQPERAWQTNAEAVAIMLEAIRVASPSTRFYQASSSEMFGGVSEEGSCSEESPLGPESPYAGSKAAAHLLCRSYRESHGLRVACGILFNHESRLRPHHFLTRKVADHVRQLIGVPVEVLRTAEPLAVGNLIARRDWGYAPEFVDGIIRILRQIDIRSERAGPGGQLADVGLHYKDYVLGTGRAWSVQDLVDTAFAMARLHLNWDTSSADPLDWVARFAATDTVAVKVDPAQFRPADPRSIRADPTAALVDLGWAPTLGLDSFLREMIGIDESGPTRDEQPG